MGILGYDFIDGLWAFHVVIEILTIDAVAGLDDNILTGLHMLPEEKHAQYIFRHLLLLQLQPISLFDLFDDTSY